MDNEKPVKNNIIRYDPKGNPAKRFVGFKSEFEKRAEELGMTPVEFLRNLIEDLNHYNEDGYEKILKNIDIKGLSKAGIIDFINYARRLIEGYNKENKNQEKIEKKAKEKQGNEELWEEFKEELDREAQDISGRIKKLEAKALKLQKEKGKTSKFLLKKVDEQLKVERNKKIAQENRKNKIWNGIMDMAKDIAEKNNISISKSLRQIEEYLKDGKNSNLTKEEMEEMIEKIDYSIYIQEVEHFTNGLSFLREEPFVFAGATGIRRKFTDAKSYDRYCKLVERFKGDKDEDKEIREILENSDLEAADREILEKREYVIVRRKNYLQR